jgi:dTMP kinase
MTNRTNNGLFIVIEGVDGSGKSTLSQGLTDRLADSCLFREPTYDSPYAGKLREVLTGKITLAESDVRELFMNDRLWDLENNLLPSVTNHRYTLLDRYYYSTAAYQGKDRYDISSLIHLNLNSEEIRQPDIIFYLKIDLDNAFKRISLRNKNLEVFEKKDQLKRIIANYDYIFTHFTFPSAVFILDANAKPEDLLDFALKKVSLTK